VLSLFPSLFGENLRKGRPTHCGDVASPTGGNRWLRWNSATKNTALFSCTRATSTPTRSTPAIATSPKLCGVGSRRSPISAKGKKGGRGAEKAPVGTTIEGRKPGNWPFYCFLGPAPRNAGFPERRPKSNPRCRHRAVNRASDSTVRGAYLPVTTRVSH